MNTLLNFLLLVLISLGSIHSIQAQEPSITAEFITEGILDKLKSYRPQRSNFGDKPKAIDAIPEGLTNPRFGTLRFGRRSWTFVLDEPKDQPARLFVDANQDGDLTNDTEVDYGTEKDGDPTYYKGFAKLKWNDDTSVSVGVYRFGPASKRNASIKNSLMYYADFGFEYTLRMDGETYTTIAAGVTDSRVNFQVDRDGNGDCNINLEAVRVGKPFNFTGTTYLVSLKDEKLSIAPSSEPIEIMPLPIDLSVGQSAIVFTAQTIDGKKIKFPSDYKGKIVLIEFWATWCSPCIYGFPAIKEAEMKWANKGFEVLSISVDEKGQAEKLKKILSDQEVDWDLVYEADGIAGRLSSMYEVTTVPFALLVDGDSGKILATRQQLRGKFLSESIEEHVSLKNSGAK
jgi:thiol-disulfide isomerase/thioredoxin